MATILPHANKTQVQTLNHHSINVSINVRYSRKVEPVNLLAINGTKVCCESPFKTPPEGDSAFHQCGRERVKHMTSV